MSVEEKEFSEFQRRECDEIAGEALPPFFCPECIPDPNAAVPVWYEEEDPFLNRRDCLYQVAVEVNEVGDYLTPRALKSLRKKQDADVTDVKELLGDKKFAEIIKVAINEGFMRRGIRDLLQYYNKLEAFETICAFGGCVYDIRKIQKWRQEHDELSAQYGSIAIEQYAAAAAAVVRSDLDGEIVTNLPMLEELLTLSAFLASGYLPGAQQDKYNKMLDDIPDIYPLGLEWVATIDDIHIDFPQSADGGPPIKFLVSVPAFNFDLIPDDNSPDVEEPEDSVILDAEKIRGQLLRLESALWVFAKYQSYFVQVEKGKIYFEDGQNEGRTYYANDFKKRINEFRKDLRQFINNNGYRLPFQMGFGRDLVTKIKIVFDNTDEKKKYIVKKVKVKSAGCHRWRKLKKKKPLMFRSPSAAYTTLMGYIAHINDIDRRLTARETMEWLDFLQTYTYPQLKVNYGINSGDMPQDQKTALGCILENDLGLGTGENFEYLMTEVLSLWDVIAYKYNQIACGDSREDGDPSVEEQNKRDELITQVYEEEIKKFLKEERKRIQEEEMRGGATRREARQAAQEAVQEDLSIEEFESMYSDRDTLIVHEKAVQRVDAGSLVGEGRTPYYFIAKQAALERFDYENSLINFLMNAFRDASGKLKRPRKEDFKELINELGMCGLTDLLRKALECLLGGMSLEKALKIMVRSALLAMAGGNLQKLFAGLPYDKQQEVLRKIEAELGNVPAPWDPEFEAGEAEITTSRGFGAPGGEPIETMTQEEYKEDVPWIDRMSTQAIDRLEDYQENTDQESGDHVTFEREITEQGSIGEAAGNIQKIIIEAYVEAIMDSVAIDTLVNELDKFPGAKLITKAIMDLACPIQPLFHPPISNFLSTLTLNVCDPTIGITWPRLREINFPSWKTIWKNLKKAAIAAITEMLIRIVMNMVYKLLVTLESIICRSLGALGQFVADGVNPAVTGTSLRDAFREAFCGDQSASEVDDVMKNALAHLGLRPEGQESASDSLMTALNNSASRNELLALMVTSPLDHHPRTVARISATVNAVAPEFSYVLGDPADISGMFAELGNYIDPEDRDRMRAALEADLPDMPINASICLTPEEWDNWNNMRENILGDAGLDPKDAKDYIDQLNQLSEDRLADVTQALINSQQPGGIAGQPFADLMDPNGGCGDGPMAAIMNPYREPGLRDSLIQASNNMFDSLVLDYTKDLIGRRGLFNYILADTEHKTYTTHVRLTRNFITKRFYVDSLEQHDDDQEDRIFKSKLDPRGMFPETISIDLRNQMIATPLSYITNTRTKGQKVYYPTIDRGIGFPKLRLIRTRKGFKEPEFKIEYTTAEEEIPDPRDPEGEDTIDAEYSVVGSFSNGIKGKDGLKKNLNYQVFFRQSFMLDGRKRSNKLYDYIVERPPSTAQQILIDEIEIDKEWDPGGRDSTYAGFLFKQFIKHKWKIAGSDVSVSDGIYDKIQNNMMNTIKDYMVTVPGADPTTTDPYEISSGFTYGFEYSPLSPESFNYVGPNGEEYDFDEEEAVIGKMEEENKRVHILNPAIYGGRYSNPDFYIEPPERHGWLGLVDSLVPEISSCTPKKADLLDIETVKSRVAQQATLIPYDERLNDDRVCNIEVPFDRIVNPGTHANIEGIVKATIRLYLSQCYLTGMPAFANLAASSGNYDDGFFEFVAQTMQQAMREESPWLSISKIKNINYWLLFLEQCVQIYDRRIKMGELSADERLKGYRSKIRQAQRKYSWPEDRESVHALGLAGLNGFPLPGKELTVEDINTLSTQSDNGMTAHQNSNVKYWFYSLAYQAFDEDVFESETHVDIGFSPPYFIFVNQIRFASKILTIRILEKECIEILKELIKAEANEVYPRYNLEMKPAPPIYNMQKYLFGLPSFSAGSTLRIGTTQYLMDKQTLGDEVDMGDVPHVVSDPTIENPLDGTNAEYEGEKGMFVLEKYVRLFDKEDQTDVPQYIKNRDKNLFGVVNLKDFQKYINQLKRNANLIGPRPEGLKYSDCFGDLEFLYTLTIKELKDAGLNISQISEYYLAHLDDKKEIKKALKQENYTVQVTENLVPSTITLEDFEPTGVTGSTGISYGIRVSFVPPSGFQGATIDNEFVLQNKSYNFKTYGGHGSTKYIFPIASGEVELTDDDLTNFSWKEHPEDPYDLECMMDKLLLDEEYNLFFGKLLPITTYTSFFATFISLTFLSALGVDANERDQDNWRWNRGQSPDGMGGWDRLMLKRTRASCRRLFAQFYSTNDFDDGKAEDFDLEDFIDSINPFSNVTPGILTWWQKRKLVKKPKECGDPFMDLFKS